MNRAFLIIGGNLGDRLVFLNRAKELIGAGAGTIVEASSIYETAPWGKQDQPGFLNQLIVVDTLLSAVELLECLLGIENKMGRKREEKLGPRTIDIDILFFNDEIIATDTLVVPHPHMADRRFVLAPLCEVAPRKIHPVSNKTVEEMLDECSDPLEVVKLTGLIDLENAR